MRGFEAREASEGADPIRAWAVHQQGKEGRRGTQTTEVKDASEGVCRSSCLTGLVIHFHFFYLKNFIKRLFLNDTFYLNYLHRNIKP